MTSRELAELLDKQATLSYGDGITWPVRILDGRSAYGRLDVLVTPWWPWCTGETESLPEHVKAWGEQWVSAERVKVRG